jgi:hypothetical protein
MKKGTFTSEWENGSVTTEAELDERTGEVFTKAVETGDYGNLEREIFMIDGDDTEMEICPACHTHIRKTVDDIKICSDFYCEYGENNFYK